MNSTVGFAAHVALLGAKEAEVSKMFVINAC